MENNFFFNLNLPSLMEIRDTRGRVQVWSMGGGRSGDQIKKFLDDLEHIPDIKCVPDLERVLENKNIFLILNILFKQFPISIQFFY